MHQRECYHLCKKYDKQIVRIQDKKGMYHLGKIVNITENSVWIEPTGRNGRCRRDAGFGYGPSYYDDDFEYNQYRYDRYYPGAAYELAFGFIVGIAIASLFFF